VFDFVFLRNNWLFIAAGIGVTLGVAIFSFLLATPLAMMVTKGRRSTLLPIKALSTFYVWLIDGIPLLLQIFFIFLVLPQIGITLPGFWAGVLVLTLNYGSRMSRIFYERFATTGKSQGEAWISLIQPFTNEFTSMIKDSTLISLTGFIHDVYWRANRVGRAEFHILEAFTIAAIIYLILITIISLGSKAIRTTMATSESGTGDSP
jgi:His/Glu/Gln/Arg/opine family amino acid ABC transporter permease subunit